MKNLWEWTCAIVLRTAERVLPPGVLYVLLWPGTVAIAVGALLWRLRFRKLARLPWRTGFFGLVRDRVHLHSSRALYFWRDRLGTPRWRARCRFEGLDHIDRDRPAMLVSLHFGPPRMLLNLLRSAGVRAAVLVPDWTPNPRYTLRTRLDALEDAAWGLADVPRMVTTGELWEARDHLRSGDALLIFPDGGEGRRVTVRAGALHATLGRGVLRLAQVTDAAVYPCMIRADAGLRCLVRVGAPLDPELVADRSRCEEAYTVLVERLLACVREAPGQCSGMLVKALEPAAEAAEAAEERGTELSPAPPTRPQSPRRPKSGSPGGA